MNPILFLFGCRRIKTDAEHASAVLNLCMRHQVTADSFPGEADGSISFCCFSNTAKKLKRLADAEGLPLEMSGLLGLPGYFIQSKKRIGLWLGTVCGLFLLILSQLFVWDVRVTGTEKMTEGEVMRELQECGFGIGSCLVGFHAGELENRVLLNSDRLAWISVYLDGTVAKVQVLERKEKPPEEPKKPANLVAKKDGQIEWIQLYKGIPAVKVGTAVRKGELLVSGIGGSETEGFSVTRAAGEVLARTEENFLIKIPFCQTEKQLKERKIIGISLNFFQKELKFFKRTGNEQGSCDIIKGVYGFSKIGLPDIPISITVERVNRYDPVTVTYSREQALEQAYRRLNDVLGSLSPKAVLLRKELKTEITDEELILNCRLLCLEDIAEQVEFDLLLPNQMPAP